MVLQHQLKMGNDIFGKSVVIMIFQLKSKALLNKSIFPFSIYLVNV